MKTYRSDGKTVIRTAPTGGYTSGDVITVRSGTSGQIGVVNDTVAAGASVTVYLRGEHELDAESGTGKTWSFGALLYWNTSTKKLTTTSTGNVKAGFALGDKAAADTTARVYIG